MANGSGTITVAGYTVDLLKSIGHGAFGQVYMGRDSEGKPVAVKKLLRNKHGANKIAAADALRSQYLKQPELRHENIIKIFNVQWAKRHIWIVEELCDFGNLNDYFRRHHFILQAIRPKINIMKQITDGIDFLHEHRIAHRDIKPANIGVVKNNSSHAIIKLLDFGLSKILDPDGSTMHSDVGTRIFQAPELFVKYPPENKPTYHRNVDVYSAGLTYMAILQAQPGKDLKPKAEGPLLDPLEVGKPIGEIANRRRQLSLPELGLVQDLPSDCPSTRKVKQIISMATRTLSRERISASQMKAEFDNMFHDLNLTRSFCLNGQAYRDVCFVNNCLVVRGGPTMAHKAVHESSDGQLIREGRSKCSHSNTQVCPLRVDQSREAMVEICYGCNNLVLDDFVLELIRKLPCHEIGLSPGVVTQGPENTFILYDRNSRHIRQYSFDRKSPVLVKKIGPLNSVPISMSYNEQHGILVVLFARRIEGISLSAKSRHTVWYQPNIQNARNISSFFGSVLVTGNSDGVTGNDRALTGSGGNTVDSNGNPIGRGGTDGNFTLSNDYVSGRGGDYTTIHCGIRAGSDRTMTGSSTSVAVLDAGDGKPLKTVLGDQGLGSIYQVAHWRIQDFP